MRYSAERPLTHMATLYAFLLSFVSPIFVSFSYALSRSQFYYNLTTPTTDTSRSLPTPRVTGEERRHYDEHRSDICQLIQPEVCSEMYIKPAAHDACFPAGLLSLDPHAGIGALTLSADWVKCCFY